MSRIIKNFRDLNAFIKQRFGGIDIYANIWCSHESTTYHPDSVVTWVKRATQTARRRAKRLRVPVFVTGAAVEQRVRDNGNLSPSKAGIVIEFFVSPKGEIVRPDLRWEIRSGSRYTHLTAARNLGASAHYIRSVDSRFSKKEPPETVVFW